MWRKPDAIRQLGSGFGEAAPSRLDQTSACGRTDQKMENEEGEEGGSQEDEEAAKRAAPARKKKGLKTKAQSKAPEERAPRRPSGPAGRKPVTSHMPAPRRRQRDRPAEWRTRAIAADPSRSGRRPLSGSRPFRPAPMYPPRRTRPGFPRRLADCIPFDRASALPGGGGKHRPAAIFISSNDGSLTDVRHTKSCSWARPTGRCWHPSFCSAGTIHLVCLPAEADLINAEGFKVHLPVRGRRTGAARIRASCPARSPPAPQPASIRATTISSACACRSRNTARRACANCSTRSASRACPACRS